MSSTPAPASGTPSTISSHQPAADRTGHEPPSPPQTQPSPDGEPDATTNVGVDRGEVLGAAMKSMAAWSARFIIVVAGLALALWLLALAWVAVLPIILAIIVCTVLWPVVHWLRRHGWQDGFAAMTVLLGFLGLLAGVVALIAPSIVSQSAEIARQASDGVAQLQQWVAGPPVNLDSAAVDSAVDQARAWLSDRSGEIATGVFSTAASVGSGLVTTVLVLVLVFFFLKDGARFLPLVRRVCGRNAGQHLTEVLTRVWNTVSGFVRTQALIGVIDAIPIGIGLLILGVPLAFTLTVLTFFAAFIPVVGALVVGSLAVLVALVSNGLTTALIVVGIVLAVQQIEGNVLQPILQSKSMELHPGVVLISVTAGGVLFGIIGAFLAVPLAASLFVVFRYLSEQVDLRTGDVAAEDLPLATPEGAVAAKHGERGSPVTTDPGEAAGGTPA